VYQLSMFPLRLSLLSLVKSMQQPNGEKVTARMKVGGG
jgi:hypothetical protein